MSNASEDEQEEVEAFIKKRVKEGTGRDYEQIVRKDVQTYKKVGEDSEFSDIIKYEGSKQYKQVC